MLCVTGDLMVEIKFTAPDVKVLIQCLPLLLPLGAATARPINCDPRRATTLKGEREGEGEEERKREREESNRDV